MTYRIAVIPSQYDEGDERGAAPALAVAVAGAATFLLAATLGESMQRPMRRGMRALGGPMRRGRRLRSTPTQLVAGVGGKWPIAAAVAMAASAIARRRGIGAAVPLLAAAAASMELQSRVKPIVDRPRPLVSRLTGKRTQSFPSGHAARSASVFGLLAHVATREGLAPAAVAYPLAAALATAAGGARVAQDRHWPTDVLGGLGLGAFVAAACAAWYDRVR